MRRVCLALSDGFDDDPCCLRRFEEARVEDGARMRYPRLSSDPSLNEQVEEGGAVEASDDRRESEAGPKRFKLSNSKANSPVTEVL